MKFVYSFCYVLEHAFSPKCYIKVKLTSITLKIDQVQEHMRTLPRNAGKLYTFGHANQVKFWDLCLLQLAIYKKTNAHFIPMEYGVNS